MKHYKKYNYDTEEYNFHQLMSSLYEIDNLSQAHKTLGNLELFTMENNSNTEYHTLFYSKLRSGWEEFENLYDKFIKDFVGPLIKEEFIYQKWPTFRVHVPGNWATPEFHCDSQEGYNHPLGEINFILPLTSCYETNTLWTESEPNKGDFEPIVMDLGNLITFNGNLCRHGNRINETSATRMTYDFRILPLSAYKPEESQASNTSGLEFKVGHYYKEVS